MKHLCVLAIISVVLLSTSGEDIDVSQCKGTVKRGNGIVCYTTKNILSKWDDALSTCTALGKTMLTILSQAENDAVWSVLKKCNMPESWLGLTQVKDSWKTLDGHELYDQGCYNNPYPNNQSLWDLEERNFLNNNNDTTCVDLCRAHNYGTAAVQESYCFCGGNFGRYGQIGASCMSYCPNSQTTFCGGSTSEMVRVVDGLFSYWERGRPSNSGDLVKSCAFISKSDTKSYWNDAHCYDRNAYICGISAPVADCNSLPGCVNCSSVSVGRWMCVVDAAETFFVARMKCRQFGGDVVMLKSLEDNLFVSQLLNNITHLTNNGFWIGLEKWRWYWTSGYEFLYANWRSQQPSGDEMFLGTMKADDGGWMSVDGTNSTRLYLCQTSNDTIGSVPTTTTKKPMRTTTRTTLPPPLKQTEAPNFYLSVAFLAGIIGGGVALLILIMAAIVIVCICTSKAKKKRQTSQPEVDTTNYTKTNDEIDYDDVKPTYFFGISAPPKSPTDPSKTQSIISTISNSSNGNPYANPQYNIFSSNPYLALSVDSLTSTCDWYASQQALLASSKPDVIPEQPEVITPEVITPEKTTEF